jgi:hypothetical protein
MSWWLRSDGRHRRVWYWLLGAVALLVVGRLIAPPLIALKVRRSIAHMEGGYRGSISGVDLSVLSGEVALLDLRIQKANGKVPVPFMHIERFVLGVQRDGYRLRQTLRAVGLHANYVDAGQEDAQQWGPHFELRDLRKQLPLELAAFYVERGQVHFRNFGARPAIDVYARDVRLAWTGLVGCLPPGWASCDSTLRGRARVMGSGELPLRGAYDRHHGSRFHVGAELRGLRPEELNALLLKYAQIDAQHGRVDLSADYELYERQQRLVLVPRLYDVQVMGGDRARTSGLREMAAGVAAGFFERRRGSKAIAYTRRAGAGGSWSIIDWQGGRAQAAAAPKPDERER